MERNQSISRGDHVERQLAHLKILSRLLAHELHAQNGARITLSRDEVTEIRTTLDLFIEEILRSRSTSGARGMGVSDVEIVPARVN